MGDPVVDLKLKPSHETLALKLKAVFDKEYYNKLCSQRSMQVLYGLIIIFLTLTVYNLRYTANFELAQVEIGSRITILETNALTMGDDLKDIKTQLSDLNNVLLNRLSNSTKLIKDNNHGS